MSKKVCKKCRLFVEGKECPICKGTAFSENWKGRLIILDPTKSEIAQKVGLSAKGEYSIKVR
ncbi:MAG: transcription elongation factor subunit Spt4 [Candidatus Woesearchaeota archaeon]